MASGLSSPLGIAGVILIIIGIVMAVIGIILLIVNQNKPKGWYIWFLLIAGLVLGIGGGIMVAIAMMEPAVPCPTSCDQYGRQIEYPQQQIRYTSQRTLQ